MSAPLRFLVVAGLAWAGLRAATLGLTPGAEVLTAARADPPGPEPAPVELAVSQPAAQPGLHYGPPHPYAQGAYPYPPHPPSPYGPYAYDPYGYGYPPGAAPPAQYHAPPSPPYQVRPAAVSVRYYLPAAMPAMAPISYAPPQAFQPQAIPQGADFNAPLPDLDRWQLSEASLPPWPVWTDTAGPGAIPGEFAPQRRDRLQLSSWALLRNRPGPQSLASGGTLGGSQAGARILYAFDPRLALSARVTSPVGAGASGGEVAGGLRITPIPALPLSLTAERRQAIGRYGGGRSDFALLAEGGLYQQPVGWGFALDGYAQAGIVGINSRDLFADGALSVTRPIYGPFSAGFGIWGGAQPHLYRIDAGPRATMRLRGNMRLHVDWRQRLYGNAEPGSGPAVTIAADF